MGVLITYKVYMHSQKILTHFKGLQRSDYMGLLMDQKTLIERMDWDVLIVLDACRYDYFVRLNTIKGRLIMVRSPGSCTIDWLKAVFTKYYDLTYISANPMVNSKTDVFGFNATKHFKKVIDVWDWGWRDDLGTVPPWNVNIAVLKHMDKKMIIHYLQPHGPWIGQPRLTLTGFRTPPLADEKIAEMVKKGEISVKTLRKAYEGNLKLVLKYVEQLIKKLPHRRIVITSDHGELLGEEGFLHPCGSNHPILREVPWLEVTK